MILSNYFWHGNTALINSNSKEQHEMEALIKFPEIQHVLHDLTRHALSFHETYPQVVRFWAWNFKKYSTKQKTSFHKERRLKKFLQIKKLLTSYSIKGMMNASCGNIWEFIEFLERFVPPRHLTNKILINFDVVPTIIKHADNTLETMGWIHISSAEHYQMWLHPKIENFLAVNTLGDANALITILNNKKIRDNLRHWGLIWIDGIGNTIPTKSVLNSAKFTKSWHYPMNFISSFNQFKWTHVTWLYLSEKGEPLSTKLKFYKNVLWRSAPSLFRDVSLMVVQDKQPEAKPAILIHRPFQFVNDEILLEIKRQLNARAPLSTVLVEVHDQNENISYRGQFINPWSLASWLNKLIDKKNVWWHLDDLVFPNLKIPLDENRFLKNFYLQTIQQ